MRRTVDGCQVPALVPISQTGSAARERPKSIARPIASA